MKPPRYFVIQGGPSPKVILDVVERRHGPPVRAVLLASPARDFVHGVVEFKPRRPQSAR